MSIQSRVAAAVLAAASAAGFSPAVPAGMITKTASLPLTSTNFNTDGSGVAPLVFQQFDTHGGALVLDAVDLSFHAKIQNQFGMTFTTPATITATVSTGNPSVPGPTITLFQPDGKTPLITAAAPNTAAALTRSVTYGFGAGQTLPQSFGSNQPVGSKFYLAPAVTEASNSLHLTAPQDLALFTGSGVIKLPVAAQAYAKISSSSGNGAGWITTLGTADATITYVYHTGQTAPETVPEPATAVLWGIGGLALLAAHRRRRAA